MSAHHIDFTDPTRQSASVALTSGDELTVSLPDNPSTGYCWMLAGQLKGLDVLLGDVTLRRDDHDTPPEDQLVGGGGTLDVCFRADGHVSGTLLFICQRPWDGGERGREVMVEVNQPAVVPAEVAEVAARFALMELPRLCVPLHRDFPPLPTICMFCGQTDPGQCPHRENQEGVRGAREGDEATPAADRGIGPRTAPLPPEVGRAVRTVHLVVWGVPYRPGEGPIHHAGGPYWHDFLMEKADSWERLAKAARIAATALPDGEDFHDTPMSRQANDA